MDCIIIPVYTCYWYTVCTIIDYYKNTDDYVQHKHWKKTLSIVIPNVYLYFPVSLFFFFLIAPTTSIMNSYGIEFFHLGTNIVFGEIYFYTIHRLFHHKLLYRYHKDHHTFRNTLGIHALYAHPVDVIVVNFGSFYILHWCLGFSLFQVLFVGSLTVAISILNAHTSAKIDFHQIHHHRWSHNYGMGLFMDKLLNTELIQETST